MKRPAPLLLFLTALACAAPSPAAPPRIEISVSAVSTGTSHPNKSTRISNRQLKITLGNREQGDLKNLELRWTVIRRDINSRKLSVAASGKQSFSLDSEETRELTSSSVKFTETEGKTSTKGKGKNKRTTVGPDTGSDYAGYVVEIRQAGRLIAEASTNGIRGRVPGVPKEPAK